MALILSDVGADQILKAYFNDDKPSDCDLTLKLFVTDVTPTQDKVASDFTEAVGGGYSANTLTAGSWVITPADDPSDAIYPQQTFAFTGALTTNPTIYGYFVVDHDVVLIYAEKFVQSFTPANNGDGVLLTPKFALSSGTPS
jgi:hypothetical protein